MKKERKKEIKNENTQRIAFSETNNGRNEGEASRAIKRLKRNCKTYSHSHTSRKIFHIWIKMSVMSRATYTLHASYNIIYYVYKYK